jgi:hypothetical protein
VSIPFLFSITYFPSLNLTNGCLFYPFSFDVYKTSVVLYIMACTKSSQSAVSSPFVAW